MTVYSIPQRALHWATVILVLFNLIIHEPMVEAADLFAAGKVPSADQVLWANFHAYSGFVILALTLIRIVLRLVQGAPEVPSSEPAPFQLAAKVTHGLFYLLLLAMPISGSVAYYLGVEAAGEVHGGPMKLVMWLLILLHVGAVLVHQFYWKTNVLARMTHGKIKA